MGPGKVLVVLLLLSCALNAHARSPKGYSFDNAADYLADASAFEPWADTLARHDNDRDAVQACIEDKKACRGRMRAYRRVMERVDELSKEEQLSLVHFFVNRTDYDEDRSQRRYDAEGNRAGWARNHWATLHEFLSKGGDCEDYATTKYFMLRDLGFAAEDMRIVVTRERSLRGFHAVLAVRQPDDSVWLLDSDNQIRKRSHHEYRFIYAMNENSVWDHRKDYTPERGGKN